MEKDKWIEYINGISPGKIKKKKEMYGKARTVRQAYDCINAIKSDQFIIIRNYVWLFPGYFDNIMRKYGNDEASVRFMKTGGQFNLETKTQNDRVENRKSLQKLAKESVIKAYSGKHEIKSVEDYRDIIRRGFVWPDTHNNKHFMPQTDLIKGWILAAGVIKENFIEHYSNPGGHFNIKIPSTHKDPHDERNFYSIVMENFAEYQKDSMHYTNWVNITGKVSGEDGADIYSMQSKRYELPEVVLNFQLIAASILRQHFNDLRAKRRKFSCLKSKAEQPLKPVLLNIAMPVTKRKIQFDWKLDNCVLIEYKPANGKLKLKKLNKGEKEVLHCFDLLENEFSKSYNIDDALTSLDYMINMVYEERFK